MDVRRLALGLLCVVFGCDEAPSAPAPMRRDAGPPAECRGVAAGRLVCEGTSAILCGESGRIERRTDCAAEGRICAPEHGCVVCSPGAIRCDGETVLRCNAEGTAETAGETCDAAAGLRCSAGGCARLCEQAAASRSYLGCEYVAVPTVNAALDSGFTFAVAIANPELVPALVAITRGAETVRTLTVAPGALEVVELPWIDALRRPLVVDPSGRRYHSALVVDGSYRIRSDVPITVHQFNPLRYEYRRDCEDPEPTPSDGLCSSFTNDASLLLPVHALTGSYLAMSRPSLLSSIDGRLSGTPGFVAIVNVDAVDAEVEIRSRAHTLASLEGRIAAHAPGDVFRVTIPGGAVLQLLSAIPERCPVALRPEPASSRIAYCALGPEHDLTGTEIVSDARLAVFSGHDCAFVPHDRWACDHLEEQLFPVEALGTSAVAPIGRQQRAEPSLVRVVASADDTQVFFAPAPSAGPSTATLDRGEHVEVTIVRPTRLTADHPVLAARFLVGQDYAGYGTSGPNAAGDPAMGLLVPDEQWRTEYVFLAPDTYAQTYVDILAPVVARVELDGEVVGAFREAPETGIHVATIALGPGVHRIRASSPVGAHIQGFARYTSYLCPAGLDLRDIADPL